MRQPLLQLQDFKICERDENHILLNHINLNINEQTFYVVYGQNGAGKSTLLFALQNQLNRYVYDGVRSTSLAYIPLIPQQVEHYFVGQTPWEEFVLTWESFVTEEVNETSLNKRIEEMVNLFNLQHKLHQPLSTLSGGEQQLVALASLLLVDMKLILIDETTSMLDQDKRKMMLHMMRNIQKTTGCSIVYVTHNECDIQTEDEIIYVVNNTVSVLGYEQWRSKNRTEGHQDSSNEGSKERSQVAIRKESKAANKNSSNVDTNRNNRKQLTIEAVIDEPYTELLRDECRTTLDVSLVNLDEDKQDKYSQDKYNQQKYKHELRGQGLLPSQLHFKEPVNIRFNQGQLTHIVGENGTGKSTLLKMIATETELNRGEIILDQKVVAKANRGRYSVHLQYLKRISYCPQRLHHYWSKETVLEECQYVVTQTSHPKCKHEAELNAYIDYYLLLFHFDKDVLHKRITSLSMGQQRKLALALTFMQHTKWLILDEPYAYLDKASRELVTSLIEQRVKSGCGVILVSHETITYSNIATNKVHISSFINKQSDKVDNKQHPSHLFHPILLMLTLLVLSMISFMFANIYELSIIAILVAGINLFVLREQIVKLIKLVVTFTVMMALIGILSSYQFTTMDLDVKQLQSFIIYTYKLVVLLCLSYPLFSLVSPFKLMRALQQVYIRFGIKQEAQLYMVMIIFNFMIVLEKLWLRLVQLYRFKYKTTILKQPLSFMVHYLRASLFIAEEIIISLELRQPLALSTIIYKLKLTKRDYILIILVGLLSLGMVVNP